MDETLYYVESPDEQVLGPMNMMTIMEGIAEGAILETALVCEVGAQEWVPLSDLAFAREESPGHEAPAREEETTEPLIMQRAEFIQPLRTPEKAPSSRDRGAFWSDTFEAPAEPRRERAAAPERERELEREPERKPEIRHSTAFDLPDEDPYENEIPAPEWSPETQEEEELVPVGDSPSGRRWILPLVGISVPVLAGALWVVFLGNPLDELPLGPPEGADEAPASASASVMQEAQELLDAGRAKEALAAYQRIAGSEPENASAQRGAGQAALLAGNPSLAVTHLEKACELRGDRPVWLTDLAEALHASGRTESAIQKLGTYLADHPEDLAWQQIRLEWMLAGGRKAEASRTYEALAKANPEGAFEQYLAGLAVSDETRAEQYLRRSIELDGTNADAHVALAHTLAEHGDAPAAIASMKHAFAVRPATAEEQAFLASLERAKPEAEAPAKPTAPASKAKPEPQVVAQATPAAKPAAKPAAAAPKPAPTPAPATPAPKTESLGDHLARVRRALAEERFAEAKQELARARAELGGSAEVRRNVALWEGIVAFEEERFAEALSIFESLDGSASYRAGGWGTGSVANWIARVHFARGDARKAVAALDAVGPTDPDEYAVARLWEGVALSSLGMGDLASRTWERIPGDVGARVQDTGRAAVKSAQLLVGAISEKEYRTAVQPIPGFENDMHFFLACAARRKQDAESARQHLAEAVERSAGREFPYYVARVEMQGAAQR